MSHQYNLRKEPKGSAKGKQYKDKMPINTNDDQTNTEEGQECEMETTETEQTSTSSPATTSTSSTEDLKFKLMMEAFQQGMKQLSQEMNERSEKTSQEMREMKQEIKERCEQTRQEIKERSEKTSQEMKQEMRAMREEIQEDNRITSEKINSIAEELKFDLTLVRDQMNQIQSNVEETLEDFKNKMEQRIQKVEKEKIPEIIKKGNEIIVQQCNKQFHKIQESTDEIMNQLKINTEEIIEQKSNLAIHQTHISVQEQQLVACIEEIKKLKAKVTHPTTEMPNIPEIVVNYVGNQLHEPQIGLPKFSHSTRNPPEFLVKFEQYYNNYVKRRGNQDTLSYLELLEQCMMNSAASWFQIVKEDIRSIEDFKTKFLKQYWSTEIQRGIKKRLEVEKYKEEGKLNRTEYLLDRAILLKSMLPPMEEVEIVELLSNNFTEQIRDMIKVQDVSTLERFMEILNREDLESKTNRIRKNQSDPKPATKFSQGGKMPSNSYNSQHNSKPYDTYGRFQKHVPYKNPYPSKYSGNQPNYQQNNRAPNYYHNPYNNYKKPQNGQYGNQSRNYAENIPRPSYGHPNYRSQPSSPRRNSYPEPGIHCMTFHSSRNYPTPEQIRKVEEIRQDPRRQRSLSPNHRTSTSQYQPRDTESPRRHPENPNNGETSPTRPVNYRA